MNNLDTFLSYIPKNISFEDIDNLLISDQNILRPLRGLAFEYLVDDIFLKTKVSEKKIQNTAIFTSKSDRNLDLLLNIWKELIYPNFNDCKLLVPSSNINLNHRSMFYYSFLFFLAG